LAVNFLAIQSVPELSTAMSVNLESLRQQDRIMDNDLRSILTRVRQVENRSDDANSSTTVVPLQRPIHWPRDDLIVANQDIFVEALSMARRYILMGTYKLQATVRPNAVLLAALDAARRRGVRVRVKVEANLTAEEQKAGEFKPGDARKVSSRSGWIWRMWNERTPTTNMMTLDHTL
jgi:phosphatidylserine/phosphatidylglycerophosphate/cardiolipin synthase-like enzyme